MAAALAAVDAAPLADVRGTFWPDTSEISFLEAAVLGGHAELAQRLARSTASAPRLRGVLILARGRLEAKLLQARWVDGWVTFLLVSCCALMLLQNDNKYNATE